MEKVKYLKDEFAGTGEVKGYYFKLVKQTNLTSMYEVRCDCVIRYEVFRRSINSRFNTETYPSSKQFGINAYTTASIERAEKLFTKLQQREEARLKKRASNEDE